MSGRATFRNRQDAGNQLAERLKSTQSIANTPTAEQLVLALPRGGVPVAYPVAQRLGAPLDLYLVRKIGAPDNEELALGALAMDGSVVMNDEIVRLLRVNPERIEQTRLKEATEMDRRNTRYRSGAAAPLCQGKTVILVDDGIATGATMKAAALAIRRSGCERLILAVPVAASDTARSFRRDKVGDEVVCVIEPHDLRGVGAFYQVSCRTGQIWCLQLLTLSNLVSHEDFTQTEDEEVIALLEKAKK
ncbi:phosphoribosyl transferase domain protein [Gonapodya prolifera JEL478]|uniref:Phosphoribosyl transferase domain protein n=1 Tax=Gonapodya prolifera (strain JEL478) TaxID=1344416 RepID=A0A139AN42_GONPJ|nr:phosphoribosyl transferase domain protein [Gonapodya prolifera JEL478]|eukprot:KXS17895.1 phosphoribosyl transferase domain protein [Gonapodya prolifera JEL478]